MRYSFLYDVYHNAPIIAHQVEYDMSVLNCNIAILATHLIGYCVYSCTRKYKITLIMMRSGIRISEYFHIITLISSPQPYK